MAIVVVAVILTLIIVGVVNTLLWLAKKGSQALNFVVLCFTVVVMYVHAGRITCACNRRANWYELLL